MTAQRTLTLDDPDSGLSFAVRFDRWDLNENRPQWHYKVSAGGDVLAEGDDLRSGSEEEPCEARALASLLSFLSAFAEAVEYEQRTGSASDNRDLFPETLRDAAEAIGSDGFALLAESLERTEDR